MSQNSTSDEYPLYPQLSEPAKQEAQAIFDGFRAKMKKVADEVLSELYTDVLPYVESDSWQNFRNALMDGFRGYQNRKIQGEYDFAAIRAKIFSEYRDDILKDLDQDNLKRIKDLEAEVSRLSEMLDRRRY